MIVSTKWIQKRVIIPHLIILGLSFYVLNVLATQSHRIKGGRVELESSERSSSSILLPISNRRRVTKESEKETKVEKDKEKGLPKKRDCKLKTKDKNKVEFECSADTKDGNLKVKDKIRFQIEATTKGASIKVEYANKIDTTAATTGGIEEPPLDTKDKQEDKSADGPDEISKEKVNPHESAHLRRLAENSSRETKTQYEIVYDSIIEYRKGNGKDTNSTDSATTVGEEYDFDNDKIIQSIPLSEWGDFTDIITDGEGGTSHFSTTTIDGLVTFNFTIRRADSEGNGTQHNVTANKMKIDFWIHDFPWQKNNSYVALLSSVQSHREVIVESDDDNDEGASKSQKEEHDGPGKDLPPPGGKKSKVTRKVDISFDDAIESTNGFVTLGEYTWDSTAKATSKSTRSSSGNDDKDNSTSIVDSASIAPSDKTSDVSTGAPRLLSEQNQTQTQAKQKQQQQKPKKEVELEDDIIVVATSIYVEKNDTYDGPDQSGDKSTHRTVDDAETITKQQIIAFSFVGPKAKTATTIYWDPEAGINYYSSSAPPNFWQSGSASTAFWISLSILSALLVGSIFYVRYKRNRASSDSVDEQNNGKEID